MTILDIIKIVDETKDAYEISQGSKIQWIAEAEASIVDRIISKFVDYDPKKHNIKYTENTPTDTELIAPVPYTRIYEYYLKAQIDYARDELSLYQNDLAQYEGALRAYWRDYNSTHEHKSVQMRV